MRKSMFIILMLSVLLASGMISCVSSSSTVAAADTSSKTTDTAPAYKWDGTTKLDLTDVFTYDDQQNDKGTSTVSYTFENSVLVLDGVVTTVCSYGFVGGGFKTNDNVRNLLSVASGIKFKVKGDGKSYRARLVSTKVTDFNYHGFIFKTTPEEQEITILFSKVSQESWGTKMVKFDKSTVVEISFQTVGQPHKSVHLEISGLEIIPE